MSGTPEITMYTTGWCPYCMRAKTLLGGKGVQVRELNVEDDPAYRQQMLEKSGGRRSVPQIFIGNRHVGGFDELYALDRAGELDRLLGRA